jgi:hypothetical protein
MIIRYPSSGRFTAEFLPSSVPPFLLFNFSLSGRYPWSVIKGSIETDDEPANGLLFTSAPLRPPVLSAFPDSNSERETC